MSILLTILKVIGIVLLILLCILLILVCCVLFVPIRYQAYIKKSETLQANVKVSYLLHIISVFLGYDNGKKSGKVKIFGITIHDFFPSEEKKRRLEEKEKKKEERRRKKEAALKKKEETKRKREAEGRQEKNTSKKEISKSVKTVNTDNYVSKTNTSTVENSRKETIKKETAVLKKEEPLKTLMQQDETASEQLDKKKQGFFERIKELKEKVVTFCKKIIDKVKNIKYTICNLLDKLQNIKGTILFYHEILTREESKCAISKIKAQSGRLLKHIKPCKVKGIVEFGFEDPATTGDLFGKVCMFYPLYGNNIVIIPHFEEEIMKGELVIKGRIRIATLLNIAWKIIFDKEIRMLYKALTGGDKNEQ